VRARSRAVERNVVMGSSFCAGAAGHLAAQHV
jgi:hypothetical protein